MRFLPAHAQGKGGLARLFHHFAETPLGEGHQSAGVEGGWCLQIAGNPAVQAGVPREQGPAYPDRQSPHRVPGYQAIEHPRGPGLLPHLRQTPPPPTQGEYQHFESRRKDHKEGKIAV